MKVKYKKYSRVSHAQNKWDIRKSDKNFFNHHNYFQHEKLKINLEKYLFYRMFRNGVLLLGLCMLGMYYLNFTLSNIVLCSVLIGICIFYFILMKVKFTSNILSQKIHPDIMYNTKDSYIFFY